MAMNMGCFGIHKCACNMKGIEFCIGPFYMSLQNKLLSNRELAGSSSTCCSGENEQIGKSY